MSENNPKLTIIIPTRNRSQFLKRTVLRIIKSINYHQNFNPNDNIEIIIVNNLSSDGTEELCNELIKKFSIIKYFKHKIFFKTAEESLCNGIKYCSGDYIWSFGDDDYMKYDAISKVINLINKNSHDLFFLNVSFLKKNLICNVKYDYIQFKDKNIDHISYKTYNSFFDLGFWHITTTFSSICFKRSMFDIEVFEEAINISPIYSYSIALFICFYKAKAILFCKPLIVMTENESSGEFTRISKVAIENNQIARFSWTNGFLKLLEFAHIRTKINIRYFLNAREITLNREGYIHTQSFVFVNITSIFAEEMKNMLEWKKINLNQVISLIDSINEFILLYKKLLIENNDFKKSIIKLEKIKKYLTLLSKIKINYLKKVIFMIFLKKNIKSKINFFQNEINKLNSSIVYHNLIKLNSKKIIKLENEMELKYGKVINYFNKYLNL